jgi:hypothetical protein
MIVRAPRYVTLGYTLMIALGSPALNTLFKERRETLRAIQIGLRIDHQILLIKSTTNVQNAPGATKWRNLNLSDEMILPRFRRCYW